MMWRRLRDARVLQLERRLRLTAARRRDCDQRAYVAECDARDLEAKLDKAKRVLANAKATLQRLTGVRSVRM